MRLYGRIETAFFSNPKVQNLSCDEVRYLLVYLYACTHGNSLGCFVLPDGYIMADLRWSAEQVSKHVSELVSKGFIERDNSTRLIRIVGWWGHNKIDNSKVAKGAMKVITALPKCKVLDNLFKDINRDGNKFLNPLLNEYLNRNANTVEPPEPEPEPESKYPFSKEKGISGNLDSDLEEETQLDDLQGRNKPTSPEAELFARGKEVLGNNAGGLIAKLLKAKESDVALARAAIETASTKQDPREYIGKVLRKGKGGQTLKEHEHKLKVLAGEAPPGTKEERMRAIDAIANG